MTTLHSSVLSIADLEQGYEIDVISGADSTIEMRLQQGFKGLFASKDLIAGSVIFPLKGIISSRPNKYSVQLGKDQHIDFPPVRQPNDDLDYAWQFMNHSCDPNSFLNLTEYCFSALKNIRQGEEITFNYLTTEYEMASPFQCGCGSAKCFGFIRGSRFLTAEQIAELFPVASIHDTAG